MDKLQNINHNILKNSSFKKAQYNKGIPHSNKPEEKPSILKNKNLQKYIAGKKISKIKFQENAAPQDSNTPTPTPNPMDSEKMENGDKIIKIRMSKRGSFRSSRKNPNSLSQKNLPLLNINNLAKLNEEMCPQDNEEENQNEIPRISMKKKDSKNNIIIVDNDSDEENGRSHKRAVTPKKKSQDIKIVPFDTIEKELILEPKILESTETKISYSEINELQSIFESFFIASLPKEEFSFAEDINNPGATICSQNLGQCGHEGCIKLPAYKAGLIFQYPANDKNPQNFQITELVTSLCFPFGVKVCFGKYSEKKKELILPKKPSDFYFVTTNGFNDQNYIYVYNFYIKIEIEEFKKTYKCDPIKNYIDILIKNNDRNLQTKFEECQNMINTQYVFVPHTCCLVSKYPYFREMRKCIYSILKLRNNEEELLKFLKHIIYEIPDINRYKTYDLQLNYFTPHNLHPIVLKSKYYNRGLNIDIKNMKILYEYFQISLLLKIFKLMLTSQKLLFVVSDSSEYKNLSLVTLALLNILYPFNWKYTYIPLLSINMLKFLQSFLPFIMGIDNNMMEYAKNNYIEKQNNITIIYLKKNKKSYIELENPDESAGIDIPSELKDMLANDLKTIIKKFSNDYIKEDNILSKLSRLANNTSQFTHFNKKERDEQIGKQLRQVFLKFFVELFGDYQEYTSSIDDTAYFNSESFLNTVPKEQHSFYTSIFNSEMFHDFLQRNVVVNSSLYNPDRYYNKYCIREKKNSFQRVMKRKKTFLNNENFNKGKETSKYVLSDITTKKKLSNPKILASTKVISYVNTKLSLESSKNTIGNNISNNSNEFLNESSLNKKGIESSGDSDSEYDEPSQSINSSFNEETLKTCISNKFSNKYIIPPCFLKIGQKNKNDIEIEDIEELILNFYGQEKLIKKNEYENKYIFDRLPTIDYNRIDKIKDISLKEKMQNEFDIINKYLLPPALIINNSKRLKCQRSYNSVKNLNKDNRLDPKIIQLEDFMKEILSSSGKNASNILYPKGIKDKAMKNEQPEKENGGSKDMVIGGKIMGKFNNLDYLSMIDFQNIIIRQHFASIIFQNKINAYQSNIISNNSYNILSKMIFNVFLYSGNKSIIDFQICRALTKSLYLYYKKNSKGKKVYLFHSFNKAKPFDIWNDKAFWQYFYEREMDNQAEKNDNSKFNVLIEIASIMNDLHFSANTQVDIIIDLIAKKEISDKDLQNVLFKTIVKQFNNRVVVSASMEV